MATTQRYSPCLLVSLLWPLVQIKQMKIHMAKKSLVTTKVQKILHKNGTKNWRKITSRAWVNAVMSFLRTLKQFKILQQLKRHVSINFQSMLLNCLIKSVQVSMRTSRKSYQRQVFKRKLKIHRNRHPMKMTFSTSLILIVLFQKRRSSRELGSFSQILTSSILIELPKLSEISKLLDKKLLNWENFSRQLKQNQL